MAAGAQVTAAVVSGVSFFGLGIATISTVGNSIVDLTKKRILDAGANKTYMLTLLEFFNLCVVVPLMLWAGDIVSVDSMPREYQIYIFVGVIASGVGKWFHAYSISLGGVALTVPFITLSPVVSVLLSMELNNEYPEGMGIFGVLMICTGAAALALAKANTLSAASASKASGRKEDGAEEEVETMMPKAAEGTKEDSVKRNKEVRAIIYMLITSVLWAVSASLQKKALKVCPFVELTVIQNSIMFVLYSVLAYNTWRQEAEEIKKQSAMEMDTKGDIAPMDGALLIRGGLDEHDDRLTKRVVNEAPIDNLAEVHPRKLRSWAAKLQDFGRMACYPLLSVHGLMHGSTQWYIITAIVEAGTVCLYFLAMKYLYVSYLLALKRGGSVVLSVAGGAFFFGEPVTQTEQLCIALMSLGVCLVVLS